MKSFLFLLSFFLVSSSFGQRQPDCFLPPVTIEAVSSVSASQVSDFYHNLLKVPQAWTSNKGQGTVFFGLDTGVPSIPDLPTAGYVFAGNMTPEPIADENNHGTMIGSVACAIDNDFGAVGIAPLAVFVPVKVMLKNGTGFSDQIAKGIRYAADVNLSQFQGYIRVISMSFSSSAPVPEIEAAIKYATSKGCICVAAAGNSGCNGVPGYPAAYPEVVSVGSVNASDVPSGFSTCFQGLDVAAYGEQNYLPTKDGVYVKASGTSFSCPQVAAVVCLVASKYSAQLKLAGASASSIVLELFKKHSKDVNTPGYDTRTGWGIPLATILSNPLPSGGPIDPGPVTGPLRTVSLSLGVYNTVWRANNSSNLTQSKVYLDLVEIKTKLRGEDIRRQLNAAMELFWTNRGFVLLDNDDEVEALYWCRHFCEMLLKKDGLDISIQNIRISTNNGSQFVLLGSQRRDATQNKMASLAWQTSKVKTYVSAP